MRDLKYASKNGLVFKVSQAKRFLDEWKEKKNQERSEDEQEERNQSSTSQRSADISYKLL